MDRRRFLESSLGAGIWVAAGACGRSDPRGARAETPDGEDTRTDGSGTAAAASGPPSLAWGVQLYTVRSLMQEDVERTLGRVAEIGYGEVEFAGYFGRSPAELRATLDAEGLSATAAHLPIEDFRDGLPQTLEAAVEIGHRYLVLPYLAGADRPAGDTAADGYRRLAGEMNDFGARCREAGVRFAYHNHDFELQPTTDGSVPLDILIENTDPALVAIEVDLFWLVHGGGDPGEYFSRYPGRFELCHIKDRTNDGEMVDVGAGAIDFASILRRAPQAGLRHYYVEHDDPGDAARSIAASLTHLRGLAL
ncbi:MAG: sugar phosphate isomerase/epimerase [Gemmatimonadetes bacterium]|nr:sugar phosphate isomerase/epimerase [Gemmatimonadota bacterium]